MKYIAIPDPYSMPQCPLLLTSIKLNSSKSLTGFSWSEPIKSFYQKDNHADQLIVLFKFLTDLVLLFRAVMRILD